MAWVRVRFGWEGDNDYDNYDDFDYDCDEGGRDERYDEDDHTDDGRENGGGKGGGEGLTRGGKGRK